LLFFFSLTRRPLFPTLFPYTTLFRSGPQSSSERTRSSLQRKLLPHRDHSHDRRIGLHHAFHRTARRLRTGEGSMKRISGVMIGIVKDLQDPKGEGRIELEFPAMPGGPKSSWAPVATPLAGKERGAFLMPEVEDE